MSRIGGIRTETNVTWTSLIDADRKSPLLVLAVRLTVLATAFTAPSYSARADDGSTSNPAIPDKSGYSLFDPTPDDLMRKFTPDRPTKGFSVRTVDAGHFELETDVINY